MSTGTGISTELGTGHGAGQGRGKGTVRVVHLYPREMSIYGDLGNTRALVSRLRWHGTRSTSSTTALATASPTTRTWCLAAVVRTPGAGAWRTTSP